MCYIFTGSHFDFVKCVPLVFDFLSDSPGVFVITNENGVFVYDSVNSGLIAYRLNPFYKNKEEVNK